MSDKLFAQRSPATIQYRTVVQCPHCGFKVTEKMPMQRKVMVFHCPGCDEYTHVAGSECCIFCQFAKQPCPEKQQAAVDAEAEKAE